MNTRGARDIMVRETPSPGPKRRTTRAKSIKRGPQLSPFQERLKETEFYTKPIIDKFEDTKSVKVCKWAMGIFVKYGVYI